MDFDKVKLTDHAKEKDIPSFHIKNILEKRKGQLFHDQKHDSYIVVKDKTVVPFEIQGQKAVVITVYRKSPHQFSSDRFQQINWKY